MTIRLFVRCVLSLIVLVVVLVAGCGKAKEQGAPPDPEAMKQYEEQKAARPKGGMVVPSPPPKFFPADDKAEQPKGQ